MSLEMDTDDSHTVFQVLSTLTTSKPTSKPLSHLV